MEKKINVSIDIMRLIAAITIVIHHSMRFYPVRDGRGICPRGSLLVEFFFFISGFLAVRKAMGVDYESGVKEDASFLGKTSFSFIKAKFINLLPYVIVSGIFSLGVYAAAAHYDVKTICRAIIYAIPDTFMLQGFGFGGAWYIGVTWYLSAMFAGLMILYPLTVKWKHNITLMVCPTVVLFVYGAFSHYIGGLYNPEGWFETFHMMNGMLRGIADVFAGGMLYEFASFISASSLSKRASHILSIAEWGTFLGALVLCFKFTNPSNMDFFVVLVLFISLCVSFSGKGFITGKLMGKRIPFLRKISMSLFLSHMAMGAVIGQELLLKGESVKTKFTVYICSAVLMTMLNMLLGSLLLKLFNSLRGKRQANAG